jgi:ABC-type branched-subunit amino acid transport system ATPase component
VVRVTRRGQPTALGVYQRTGVLDSVEERLSDEDGAPVLLIIGPHGAGKSEAAAQIATRFAQTKTGKDRIRRPLPPPRLPGRANQRPDAPRPVRGLRQRSVARPPARLARTWARPR